MLRLVRPQRVVASIHDVQAEQLQRLGLRALLLDLDDTLVSFGHTEAPPRLLTWLMHLQAAGLRVVIVSNNRRERVVRFADPLAVPYVHSARKPLHLSFRRALSMLAVQRHEAAIMGDQLLTDVLGGNLVGLYTIWVKPISLRAGWWPVLNRRVERLLCRWMGRRYGERFDLL